MNDDSHVSLVGATASFSVRQKATDSSVIEVIPQSEEEAILFDLPLEARRYYNKAKEAREREEVLRREVDRLNTIITVNSETVTALNTNIIDLNASRDRLQDEVDYLQSRQTLHSPERNRRASSTPLGSPMNLRSRQLNSPPPQHRNMNPTSQQMAVVVTTTAPVPTITTITTTSGSAVSQQQQTTTSHAPTGVPSFPPVAAGGTPSSGTIVYPSVTMSSHTLTSDTTSSTTPIMAVTIHSPPITMSSHTLTSHTSISTPPITSTPWGSTQGGGQTGAQAQTQIPMSVGHIGMGSHGSLGHNHPIHYYNSGQPLGYTPPPSQQQQFHPLYGNIVFPGQQGAAVTPTPPATPTPSMGFRKGILRPSDITPLSDVLLYSADGEASLDLWCTSIEDTAFTDSERLTVARARTSGLLQTIICSRTKSGLLPSWVAVKYFLYGEVAKRAGRKQGIAAMLAMEYDGMSDPDLFANNLQWRHEVLVQRFPNKTIPALEPLIKSKLLAPMSQAVKDEMTCYDNPQTAIPAFLKEFRSARTKHEGANGERRVNFVPKPEFRGRSPHQRQRSNSPFRRRDSPRRPFSPRRQFSPKPDRRDEIQRLSDQLEQLKAHYVKGEGNQRKEYCPWCVDYGHTLKECKDDPPLGRCLICYSKDHFMGDPACPGHRLLKTKNINTTTASQSQQE